MLRGVEVEQVKQQQVRTVLPENVRGGIRPDVVAPDDVPGREGVEVRL